jgi:hypothetical protein
VACSAATRSSFLILLADAQCGDPGAIDGDRFVGVLRLAASLISRLSTDDNATVMHGYLARIEIDGLPSQSSHLAAADTCREFQQEQCGEPIRLD